MPQFAGITPPRFTRGTSAGQLLNTGLNAITAGGQQIAAGQAGTELELLRKHMGDLQKEEQQKLARDRYNILKAQEGRAAEEYGYKKEQERILGELLSGISDKTKEGKVVPASTKQVLTNADDIKAAKEAIDANEKVAKQQEDASRLYDKYLAEELEKITPKEGLEKVSPGVFRSKTGRPASSATYKLTDAEGKELTGSAYLSALSEDIKKNTGVDPRNLAAPMKDAALDTILPSRGIAKYLLGRDEKGIAPNAGKSEGPTQEELAEQANKRALERAGIVDKKGNVLLPDLKDKIDVPKELFKTVHTPASTKQVSVGKEDWLLKELNKGKEAGLGGAAAERYQKAVIDRADKLFEVDKSKVLSIRDQLALQKYADDRLGNANKVADYRAVYPNMPKSITTLDGAKAYAASQNKKGMESSFKKELYKNLTGKDSDDIQAIDDYLVNSPEWKNMSKSDKDALVARLTAMYADESSWDLTDIFGGSAAGDVLFR